MKEFFMGKEGRGHSSPIPTVPISLHFAQNMEIWSTSCLFQWLFSSGTEMRVWSSYVLLLKTQSWIMAPCLPTLLYYPSCLARDWRVSGNVRTKHPQPCCSGDLWDLLSAREMFSLGFLPLGSLPLSSPKSKGQMVRRPAQDGRSQKSSTQPCQGLPSCPREWQWAREPQRT